MKDLVLAIDCGTQSLRGMLFDAKGKLIAKEKIDYEPYYSVKPTWAEQDAEVYWNALCDACKKLKAGRTKEFERIAGVGVTTMRDTPVCVDKDGNPLRPAMVWLDRRKAKRVYDPKGIEGLAYAITGMREAVDKTHVDGKSNWIKQNQPEIWRKTHKFLLVSAFLNFRLTGEFVDSIGSTIGHIPFNYKKLRWSRKGELGQNAFPMEEDKLPSIVKPGETMGQITKLAAKATGISEGTPVIACGSDKGCETVGIGALDLSMGSLSFGTTATIQTTSPRYFEPLTFMPAYPAAIPDSFNPEVEIFRGYWMITWFKNEFGYKEVKDAAKKGVVPEVLLNEMLQSVPAGSMGLMTQPYWAPGLKMPYAKGAIIGFGDVHTRAYVYRSVIEGLAYALKDGMIRIEKTGHRRIEKLGVSGGASQSEEICQIAADVFDRPILKGETHENSGLGAAIVTSVGAGLHSGFREAIGHMIRYRKTYEPDPRNVYIYRELFDKVYTKMFKAMKGFYQDIRKITGYPERID